jgi:hypothetical protein
MIRSGSTWSYNVVKLLMRDHSESTHTCYTDDIASSFMEAGALPEHIIVKCHGPDYFGRFLIKHQMCRTVYTFREPLDGLASAVESFGGAYETHLAVMRSSLELLQYQVEVSGVHAIWYDDILDRSADRVAAIADYLGIACSRHRSDEIATMMDRENVRQVLSQLGKSGDQKKTSAKLFNRSDRVTNWDTGTLFSDHHIRKAPTAPQDLFTPEQIAAAITAFSGFVDTEGRLLDVVKNIGRIEVLESSGEAAKQALKQRPVNETPSEIVAAARAAFEGRFDGSSPMAGAAAEDAASLNAVFARLAPTGEAAGPPLVTTPEVEPVSPSIPFPVRPSPGTSPFARGPNPLLVPTPSPQNPLSIETPVPVSAPTTIPIPITPAASLATAPARPLPTIPLPLVSAPASSTPPPVPPSPTPSADIALAATSIVEDRAEQTTQAELAAERVLSRRAQERTGDGPAVSAHSTALRSRIPLPGKPGIDPETGEALTPAELAARHVLAKRQQHDEMPRAVSTVKRKRQAANATPTTTWADVEHSLLTSPAESDESGAEEQANAPVRRGGFVSNALKMFGRLASGGRSAEAPLPAKPARRSR